MIRVFASIARGQACATSLAVLVVCLVSASAGAQAGTVTVAKELVPARASAGVDTTKGVPGDSTTPPATIADAVSEYRRTGVARPIKHGEFVTYPYQHSQPTLTCAPLRACVIELDAGESVWNPIRGDAERWEVQPARAGVDGTTTLVVVKPRDCAPDGLTTNLVLPTSKGRIYHFTLDSPPCRGGTTNPRLAYTEHVRFYYPDDIVAEWSRPAPPSPQPTYVAPDVEHFNFDYRTKRDRGFPFQPAAIFDDGVRTFIKLPAEWKRVEAPVLFVLADDGKTKTLLNYTVAGTTYVTDRVFRRAVMVVSDGKQERVLRIENRGSTAPAAR